MKTVTDPSLLRHCRGCLPSAAGLLLLLAGTARSAEIRLDGQTFTLPDGYTIERIATEELTRRPVHADFDDQGRMYLAESSGSNDPVEEQLKTKPHSILRLVDTNGDGVFDQRTVFADHMMFPAGVLWHDGSVYVTAPPVIWKLTDTNDDGVADQREEWFNPGTLTGCANDLHGPFPGRDGWIYWCKGAFAEQKLPLAGGGEYVTRAAQIFRRQPSGGGVEVVMTGGMDNPVEFVMNEGGDRFFTSTFMLHPGGGKRDGIGNASYGALFGKRHNVLDGHPQTQLQLNEPMTQLGPAAPAGLCFLESSGLGSDFQGNLLAALFNLHKVTRHQLVADGSGGYRTIDSDFLVSDSMDFHPTDVMEDADGSLVVINTGGWYTLCCPTSQLYKPDVLGAIYRIRKTGAPAPADPRGLQLPWDTANDMDLAFWLEDERPAVRRRAIGELARRGPAVIPSCAVIIRRSQNAYARVAAVWALARIDHPGARAMNSIALLDENETVRQAAIYSMALWRDPDAVAQLISVLKAPSLPNRAAAAEALGRIKDPRAVPALVEVLAAGEAPRQPMIRALIDIGDPGAIRAAARGTDKLNPALLTALDQLGAARPEEVLPLLDSTDPASRETADWILRRHRDWGKALTGAFDRQLESAKQPDDSLAARIGAMSGDAFVQKWLIEKVPATRPGSPARITLIRAMRRADLKETPDSWKRGITMLLEQTNAANDLTEVVETAAGFRLKEKGDAALTSKLIDIAANKKLPDELRLQALASVPQPFATNPDGELFAFVLGYLDPKQPVNLRQLAARTLNGLTYQPKQRQALIAILPSLGPMELGGLLDGFAEPADSGTNAALLKAIGDARAFRSLNPDQLRRVFAGYPAEDQKVLKAMIDKLDEGFAEKQKRVDTLLVELKDGDVRRGQEIFNSPKAACSSCHAIGYLGGTLGPDLTRIGQIRNERDLLEAVLYPSASFVRSYEPMMVIDRDGEMHTGILHSESDQTIVLASGPQNVERIERSDIREMTPGSVSIMPQGLGEVLTRQELADLLAFLKATRW